MVEGPEVDGEREAGVAADAVDGAAGGRAGAVYQPPKVYPYLLRDLRIEAPNEV